jgi:hypothetical protein
MREGKKEASAFLNRTVCVGSEVMSCRGGRRFCLVRPIVIGSQRLLSTSATCSPLQHIWEIPHVLIADVHTSNIPSQMDSMVYKPCMPLHYAIIQSRTYVCISEGLYCLCTYKHFYIYIYIYIYIYTKVIIRTVPRNNTSMCLFCFLYIFAATCFGPCWPSSGGIHNYSRKLPYNGSIVLCYRSRLLCMLGKYCRCLFFNPFRSTVGAAPTA